jgi:hypothetical protein
MIDRHEDIPNGRDYLVWLKKKAIDSGKNDVLELVALLIEEDLSPAQFAELHGLFRHWGHPTVQEELGCEKTRVIGQTRSYPDCPIQRKMVVLINRQFYISFLTKHGRPPCVRNIDDFREKAIFNLFISSAKGVNLYSPEYRLEDWGYVQFQKEFEFDYNIDYTELMDDKALSPLRSELRTAFNPERLGYNPGKP